MHLDPAIATAGLIVGFTVGLTGMGGGALATPLLVLVFRVPALAAVGSDVVASLVMKPFGAGVHMRRGTVRTDLVKWLAVGSVPAAFAGVLLLRLVGNDVEPLLQRALGLTLLATAGATLVRSRLRHVVDGGGQLPPPTLKRFPTVAVGIAGGLLVGMTSVGSGSLIIVSVLLLYPGLSLAELVGTDLLQAVPLVASASLAHLMFGDVRLGITSSLLVGAIPGVLAGARLSSRAPDRLVRSALLAVLVVSGLKLI